MQKVAPSFKCPASNRSSRFVHFGLKKIDDNKVQKVNYRGEM